MKHRNSGSITAVFAVVLAAVALFTSCGKKEMHSDAQATENAPPAEAHASDAPPSKNGLKQAATVTFDDNPDTKVYVEVVSTRQAITRGLMDREYLGADAGMLFLMPSERVQSFWMKNTIVPLDLIFIGSDMRVVGIVKNAVPQTLTSRTVGKPSKFVLEVNAGWSDKREVKAGSVTKFEGVSIPDRSR